MAFIEYEKQGHISVVRINRPERMNALGREALTEFAQTWIRFRDDEDAWVAILTGVGRAFTVGMDVKERAESGLPGVGWPDIELRDPFMNNELEKPVIAAVNGFAFGGGFNIALRCGLRIAAPSASFQITEVARGSLQGWQIGALERLPFAIGAELALGGILTAQRAYEVGLVNAIATEESLMEESFVWAERLLKLPPLAVRYNWQLYKRLVPEIPGDLRNLATELRETVSHSEDLRESMRSFLEKRPPQYQGR
jgi:enoyl-CoA hydratase/carnithine racemase